MEIASYSVSVSRKRDGGCIQPSRKHWLVLLARAHQAGISRYSMSALESLPLATARLYFERESATSSQENKNIADRRLALNVHGPLVGNDFDLAFDLDQLNQYLSRTMAAG